MKPRLPEPLKEALQMKPVPSNRVQTMQTALVDLAGLEQLPRLREFLCDPVLEVEGQSRERAPGSIYLVPKAGVLAVTLKEPSQALMLRCEAASLKVLWSTLEAALASSSSFWETDQWARPPRKGKRK